MLFFFCFFCFVFVKNLNSNVEKLIIQLARHALIFLCYIYFSSFLFYFLFRERTFMNVRAFKVAKRGENRKEGKEEGKKEGRKEGRRMRGDRG